jgi:hypothetical protein
MTNKYDKTDKTNDLISIFCYNQIIIDTKDLNENDVPQKIMNYNFTSNWKKVLKIFKSRCGKIVLKFAIEEWIKNEVIDILLRKFPNFNHYDIRQKDIQDFLKSINKNDKKLNYLIYSKHKYPSDYSCDCMDTGCDEANYFDFELRTLLLKYNVIEDYDEYTDFEKTEKIDNLYQQLTKDIANQYHKNCINNFQIFHSCFTYGAVINLYLARILDPDEEWELIKSQYHLTCVNKIRTKIFDILLFEKDEEDFGGMRAFLYATNSHIYEKKYQENAQNYKRN